MNKPLLTLAFLLLALHAFSQPTANKVEFNFGFEKITSYQNLPDHYFQWGNVGDYNLSIDPMTRHGGKYAVRIQATETRKPKSFGCVAYQIPALFEGKELELRAYIKMEQVKEGPIGLLLRVDGVTETLAFENMATKNIQGTSDWTMYSVKLPLPKNAKTIFYGAMLLGTGTIWVDDFELLVDGKDIAQDKLKETKMLPADKDPEFDNGSNIKSFKATENQVNNLKILGMVWGFLKYYHPNIAAGNFNWDYELMRILPAIIDAKNANDRDAILSTWIKQLGAFDTTAEKEAYKGSIKLAPDLEWITTSNLSSELSSQLIQLRNAKRNGEHYYIGLMTGVENPDFNNEKPYPSMKYPDAGFRLLSLFRYWNVIQYYFPYRYLIEEDWKNVLKEFVPTFLNASNELEYKLAVLELIGRVHDTHANIWGRDQALYDYWGVNSVPAKIEFVENKAVVTGFYEPESVLKTGLLKGDVLTKINQKPVEKFLAERLKYTPASNYPTQLRNLAKDLLRTNDTALTVEFTRNNKTETRVIKTCSREKNNMYADPHAKDTCFKMIAPDIAYIYPGTIKSVYLPQIMSEVQKTKGLIIDFRCYPSDFTVFTLGNYLMPDSTAFVKFSKGSISSPALFTLTPSLTVGTKNAAYYKGKVIILVNENTQSSAEYHTMAFRVAPRAKVIGSTTAGADGNVSPFQLPGGIRTMISGIGIYYPDGKETQRIGIVPDIVVKPTINGILSNKDEVLDKAIELINGN
jgi:hypothetical protein